MSSLNCNSDSNLVCCCLQQILLRRVHVLWRERECGWLTETGGGRWVILTGVRIIENSCGDPHTYRIPQRHTLYWYLCLSLVRYPCFAGINFRVFGIETMLVVFFWVWWGCFDCPCLVDRFCWVFSLICLPGCLYGSYPFGWIGYFLLLSIISLCFLKKK